MPITAMGVTPVIISEEQVKEAMRRQEIEYLVGVRLNEATNRFEATLIADGTRY